MILIPKVSLHSHQFVSSLKAFVALVKQSLREVLADV